MHRLQQQNNSSVCSRSFQFTEVRPMVRKNLETRNRNHSQKRRIIDEGANNNKILESRRKIESKCIQPKLYSLRADEIPLQFREPFIDSGYRRPYMTAKESIWSLFTPCNETVNVWSHIAALLFFCSHYYSIFWNTHKPTNDPFVYPLVAFAFGVSIAFLMSAGAHLFSSISPRIRHVCFFFDYAAISLYTFTAGQAFYFYSRPLDSDLMVLNIPEVFLAVSMFISLTTTTICCASRHRWHRYKHLLRTGGYVLSWFFNTLPYTWRLHTCSAEHQCHAISKPYFMRHVLCYAVAAVANASKFPERLMRGAFDFIGQSHHFLHIVSAIGAGDEFTAMVLDMEGMREQERIQSVTFNNTLGLTALAFVGNVAIVLLFSFSLENNEEEEKIEDY